MLIAKLNITYSCCFYLEKVTFNFSINVNQRLSIAHYKKLAVPMYGQQEKFFIKIFEVCGFEAEHRKLIRAK